MRGREETQLAFMLIPQRAGIPGGQKGKPRLPAAGDMPRMLEATGPDFKAQSPRPVPDTTLGPLPRGLCGPAGASYPHRGVVLAPVRGRRPGPFLPFPPPRRLMPEPTQAPGTTGARPPLPSPSSPYLLQEAQGQDGRVTHR